jgi:hypothetical protein
MRICKTRRETADEVTKYADGNAVSHSHKFVTVLSDDFPST